MKICWQITNLTWMQPFQYDLQSPAAKDFSIMMYIVLWCIMHTAAEPRNLDRAIPMRLATSRCKPASPYAHGNTTWQHSCSHSIAICNQTFKKRTELRGMTSHWLQNTEEEPIIRTGLTAAAPAAHTRYTLSSSAKTILLEKNERIWKSTRFRAPAFSQNKAHATNVHTTTTMRFATSRRKPASFYAHVNTTWPHSCIHCDLQPQIPNHHITAPAHEHTQIQPKQLQATASMREQKRVKITCGVKSHTLI